MQLPVLALQLEAGRSNVSSVTGCSALAGVCDDAVHVNPSTTRERIRLMFRASQNAQTSYVQCGKCIVFERLALPYAHEYKRLHDQGRLPPAPYCVPVGVVGV